MTVLLGEVHCADATLSIPSTLELIYSSPLNPPEEINFKMTYLLCSYLVYEDA